MPIYKLGSRDDATPAVPRKPLAYRVLALTDSFETGQGIPECFAGITGDFDGQSLSFGALQWNFGQNSLQPLLHDMLTKHPVIMRSIVHNNLPILQAALQATKPKLMAFARSVQHPIKHVVEEPWKRTFKSLGRAPACQRLQLHYAKTQFAAARTLCAEFKLWSERARALLFYISVQNGGIDSRTKAHIESDFAKLTRGLTTEETEIERMRIVANRLAEATKPRWIEDARAQSLLRARRGCCAWRSLRFSGSVWYSLKRCVKEIGIEPSAGPTTGRRERRGGTLRQRRADACDLDAIADLKLCLCIGQVVEALQDQNLEHEQRIKRRTTGVALLFDPRGELVDGNSSLGLPRDGKDFNPGKSLSSSCVLDMTETDIESTVLALRHRVSVNGVVHWRLKPEFIEDMFIVYQYSI